MYYCASPRTERALCFASCWLNLWQVKGGQLLLHLIDECGIADSVPFTSGSGNSVCRAWITKLTVYFLYGILHIDPKDSLEWAYDRFKEGEVLIYSSELWSRPEPKDADGYRLWFLNWKSP